MIERVKWLHFEPILNCMTCKLCVKHKKSNVMTGNECRNWKTSMFKTHAHSADNEQSVITEAKTPLQFQICLMRKKGVTWPYFVH